MFYAKPICSILLLLYYAGLALGQLGESCNEPGEIMTNEMDCKTYFICVPAYLDDEDENIWISDICEDGKIANEIGDCVVGECRGEKPFDCAEAGAKRRDPDRKRIFVDPHDCTKYYVCQISPADGGWLARPFQCPKGETFSVKKGNCVAGPCPQ